MRLSLAFTAFWLATALGQNMGPCTREMARTDGCAAVINPNACYNQFRFRNAQTLQCIEGADDNEKAQRVRSPNPRASTSK